VFALRVLALSLEITSFSIGCRSSVERLGFTDVTGNNLVVAADDSFFVCFFRVGEGTVAVLTTVTTCKIQD
jgi:hypothetical protein